MPHRDKDSKKQRTRSRKGAKVGLEDELFNMFRQFDMFGKGGMSGANMAGGNINHIVMSMIRNMELDMMRKIRSQLDNLIHKTEQDKNTAWKTEGVPYGSTTGHGDLDPFKILGVDMNASYEEVRSAYRKRARQTHPDHGGSSEEFVKVNAAWEAIQRFKGWYGK